MKKVNVKFNGAPLTGMWDKLINIRLKRLCRNIYDHDKIIAM